MVSSRKDVWRTSIEFVYDWCIMLTKTRWILGGACVRHHYIFDCVSYILGTTVFA